MDPIAEIKALMEKWDEESSQLNYYPVPTLNKLIELIELEKQNFYKLNPDPFNKPYTLKTNPNCKLGQISDILFCERFYFKHVLTKEYLTERYYIRRRHTARSVVELNIAACRLLLNIIPVTETLVLLMTKSDIVIRNLFKWSKDSEEPLQTYATGLLSAVLELQNIAFQFKNFNDELVPLMMKRLKSYQIGENHNNRDDLVAHSTQPLSDLSGLSLLSHSGTKPKVQLATDGVSTSLDSIKDCENLSLDNSLSRSKSKLRTEESLHPDSDDLEVEISAKRKKLDGDEMRNSSWKEPKTYMIGTLQMYPLTAVTKQIFILKYLTSIAPINEFLIYAFKDNLLECVLLYLDIVQSEEGRLTFEALRYLSALFIHKNFAIKFMQSCGLAQLLAIPRPSFAAFGVAICLFSLSNCEEAMSLLPDSMVIDVVKYALWLLEDSHYSVRDYAASFFGLTFQFRAILEEFDNQDGLKKLHNILASWPLILSNKNSELALNREVQQATMQNVHNACLAYKRYLEAHLFIKEEQLRKSQVTSNNSKFDSHVTFSKFKSCQSSPEEVLQQIESVFQTMPFWSSWQPVDQMIRLGDLTLLLQIISISFRERAETGKFALDALSIACVVPAILIFLCDNQISLPTNVVTGGFHIILKAMHRKFTEAPELQKSALKMIINCVCQPIQRPRYSLSTAIPSIYPSAEQMLKKVWKNVESYNGIMLLTKLIYTKTPKANADCIRALACKALAGLARSTSARQIISKLPLIIGGDLQMFTRTPIYQENLQEHLSFQKSAEELVRYLFGKSNDIFNDLDISLANIHRANIVAQTKINFSDHQLMQLIQQYLQNKGLSIKSSVSTSNQIQSSGKFNFTPKIPSTSILPFTSQITHSTPTNSLLFEKSSIKINKKPRTILVNYKRTPASQNSPFKKPQIKESSHQKVKTPISISPQLENSFVASEESRVTLESIITEYLTNQHALCKNPMAVCPEFNLFVPHKCPVPKQQIRCTNNFAIRNTMRQAGYFSKAQNEKLVHSRFCPILTITKMSERYYTCVKFLSTERIAIGSLDGSVHIYNYLLGIEENMFLVQFGPVGNIQTNNFGNLILTSGVRDQPFAAVWSVKSTYNLQYHFPDIQHLEFSKAIQDKVIGTKKATATIYDVNTGNLILQLNPRVSNQYYKNCATFSYNDKLVLSDGVLFDVNSGIAIHKLEKLNSIQSGVFHPNEFEIVSNTEVWDVRMFQLIKTVPTLNFCRLTFSPVSSVIYACTFEQRHKGITTGFDTISASDYSSIATYGVKRNLYDLAVHSHDTQIATVELSQASLNTARDTVVRLYDVGRSSENVDILIDENVSDEDLVEIYRERNFETYSSDEPFQEVDTMSGESSSQEIDSSSSEY